MHELSLAGGVLRVVEEAAAREHFSGLLRLRLEAGSLSGVDVRALEFALQAIAPGTLLEKASVQIDEPAGQAWCMSCAGNVVLNARGDPCPACGGFQLMPNGGMELRVVDMEVVDA